MSSKDFRKEPVFSDSNRRRQQDHDDLFDSRLPPKDELDPRIRVAIISVSIVCGLFIADWLYERYTEYRAVQMLEQMAKAATQSLQESTQRSMDQLRESSERARQEAEHRRLALRDQRAETNRGKWLAKNCSDWRRAYEDLEAPTAEREMKRHCEIYEKYLQTGIADTPGI